MLRIKRRNLPHWTLEEAVYFITYRLLAGNLNHDEQFFTKSHIVKGNREFYDLYSVIVMPDHVHLILKPKDPYSLDRIMKGIKGASAHEINKNRNSSGSIWQDESFDRIIRDYDELIEKLEYMFNNPIKKGLCEDTNEYVGWYINEELLGV